MIPRRAVLRAPLGVPLLAAAATLPVDILDAHIHIYDTARPEGVPWPPKTDPLLYRPHHATDFRQATRGFGVSRAVIVEASPWLEDNQWILDRTTEAPDLFAGVVGNLPAGKPGFAAALERFRRNPRFRGIRLNESLLPAAMDDLRLLSQAGLALDVIGGPGVIARAGSIAERYPELRIVIDHLPFESSPDLGPVRGAENVYIKVSGVVQHKQQREALDELWSTFGPARLVYASNWPVSNRFAPYATVLKIVQDYFATKGQAAQSAFFSGNARRLYRL